MSLTKELEKLRDLYDDGVLSEAELTEAKRQLLRPPLAVNPKLAAESFLAESAERYVSFQIAMSVIGLVIFLFFFCGVVWPSFQKATGSQTPTFHIQPPSRP